MNYVIKLHVNKCKYMGELKKNNLKQITFLFSTCRL